MSPSSLFDLPQNLIIDILLLVTIKYLFRCQFVCKSLQLIITSSDFIHLHHKHQQVVGSSCFVVYEHNSIRGYFNSDEKDWCTDKYFKPFVTRHRSSSSRSEGIRLAGGSSGGLFCLFDSKKIYLWNPAIRVYKSMSIRSNFTCNSYDAMALGFAYVPKINDFKLVRILLKPLPTNKKKKKKQQKQQQQNRKTYSYQVDVYTLSTKSWKRIDNHNLSCGKIYSTSDLVNGSLHWLAQDADGECYILGFHMEDELFHKIPFPKGFNYFTNFRLRGYKENSLVLSLFSPPTLDVWVMKNYGINDSWFKLFGNLSKKTTPVCFMENDLIIVVNDDDGETSLYDMKTCQPKKLSRVIKSDHFDPPIPYTESLFLLNQSNQFIQ